jgi:manganese transport protein
MFSNWKSTSETDPLRHGGVRFDRNWPLWRRILAFFGPGYLVAVGYMDPGNWATSLAGGSRYGYLLLSVVLISSLMAVILQSLAARLAVATSRDLAEICRDIFPKYLNYGLWAMAELAIIATDIAEVIGTAIGFELLFGLPLTIGIAVTTLDALLLITLQRFGFRTVEALIIAILAIIAVCFTIELILARPDWADVTANLLPKPEIITDPNMLYLALGILGATVMPHNLYLHSSIVQTRPLGVTTHERRESLTFATLDSTLALTFAFLVNAAIIILAAASFHAAGRIDIVELSDAYSLLSPLLGSQLAPTLFAIALIACGLNATVTATLAGQIVMEGFLGLKFPPVIRRLATRLIAVIPAAWVAIVNGDKGATSLLVSSQVILSLQLPFAIIPLVFFTSQSQRMGVLVAPRWLTGIAAMIALTIVILNGILVLNLTFLNQ